MQLRRSTHARAASKQTAFVVASVEDDVTEDRDMLPFGLSEKATEKQNAQNHYDSDYDDLDQTHN